MERKVYANVYPWEMLSVHKQIYTRGTRYALFAEP